MPNKIFKLLVAVFCIAGVLFMVKMETFAAPDKNLEKIEISKSKVSLKVGEEIIINNDENADITVEVTASSKNKGFRVSTKDNKKVKIKKTNLGFSVTALKSGNAKIKVMLYSNKKISQTIELNISGKKKAAFGKIVKVTGKSFNKEVLKAKGKVIVDYSAKWCGYCQLLEPIYKEAAKVRPLYKFTRVDADEEEELIESQGIGGFPTLHIYENGKFIKEGGYMQDMTVWDLIDWIESK